MSAPVRHWPEYLMEVAGLGAFMVSAAMMTTVLEHPASPIRTLITDATARRLLMGLAMGLTSAALVYSPWGRRSGAHLNPAVTLTFLRLGKISRHDAFWYACAQFAGGVLGIAAAAVILRQWISDPAVNYVATLPGTPGPIVAFVAEAGISFLLMTAILAVSNHPRIARLTGAIAACLVASFITFEAPLSGMSMNPARTFGSALPAHVWTALWVYFLAPPVAMVLAGQLYRFRRGAHRVFCAKLHHHNDERCIFRCNYAAM